MQLSSVLVATGATQYTRANESMGGAMSLDLAGSPSVTLRQLTLAHNHARRGGGGGMAIANAAPNVCVGRWPVGAAVCQRHEVVVTPSDTGAGVVCVGLARAAFAFLLRTLTPHTHTHTHTHTRRQHDYEWEAGVRVCTTTVP